MAVATGGRGMRVTTMKTSSYPGDRNIAVFVLNDGEQARLGNQVHNVVRCTDRGVVYYASDRFAGTWRNMAAVKAFTLMQRGQD